MERRLALGRRLGRRRRTGRTQANAAAAAASAVAAAATVQVGGRRADAAADASAPPRFRAVQIRKRLVQGVIPQQAQSWSAFSFRAASGADRYSRRALTMDVADERHRIGRSGDGGWFGAGAR